MRRVLIQAGDVQAIAELNDTRTADTIWNALPITAAGNTWGDEIYFSTSIILGEEKAQEIVAEGDLGYWPPGKAFCIFFGPTPASNGDEIRPASPVNVFGHVVGDAKIFKKVHNGQKVLVERSRKS
jgi:hypothetical protein